MAKKHNLNLAFASYNSLSKYIKTGKDQLDPLSRCSVVYKINCHDCEASHVGQTKRLLKIRVKEHFTDIKKSSGSPSVISDHQSELNHDFDWEKIYILDTELSWKKRIVSEIIHIKKQQSGINKVIQIFFLKIIFC